MAVRKVAVTLPEELYDMVERARAIEHRTRSEVIQEALRTHFGEPVYVPTDEERRAILHALDELARNPHGVTDSATVHRELRQELDERRR